MRLSAAVAALGALLAAGRGSAGEPELETVPKVDLSRYLGTWYEIARLPSRFQKDCFAPTAIYDLRPDGDIEIRNRCHKGSPQGKEEEAKGKAWVADKSTNAKLKVQFFWPFRGDYWILELGDQYEYTVVGTPNRSYLWILSRSPQLDEALYQAIVARAKERGFDTSKLIRSGLPAHRGGDGGSPAPSP
jgi:apolipoprotein D and lipocalin family protein